MDFFLFLLVNAVLFIRPSELVPELAVWPIYNFVIVANLLVAGSGIVNQFDSKALIRAPVTICVLGVLAAIVLSHLARFDFWSARIHGFEFAKVVAYFLLLMAVVNTPRRLYWFLAAIVAFTLFVNLLAVLHFHHVINMPALDAIMQGDYNELTGEKFEFPRMRATGILNDPNDLSMVVVACIFICGYGLCCTALGGQRFLLVAPIGFLGYCLMLTQSRGGLLALGVGGAVLSYYWLGKVRTLLLATMLLPAVAAIGGRQANIVGGLSGGTGEQRIEFWREGFMLFKAAPLFGIGKEHFVDEIRHVAHNSFVHSYTELGFFGGTMFLGLYFIAGSALWRILAQRKKIDDKKLRILLPFALAMLAAFAVSMLSISRAYVIPTYLVAGLAVLCDRYARKKIQLPALVFNTVLVRNLGVASVASVLAWYAYIRVHFLIF